MGAELHVVLDFECSIPGNVGLWLKYILKYNTTSVQCCLQGPVARGQGLEVQGQGLINWSSRTSTFLEDIEHWVTVKNDLTR